MPVANSFKVGFNQGASELHVSAGGSISLDAGASMTISAGPSVTTLVFVTGTSSPGIYAGFDLPSFLAPAGSVYIRSQGSVSGLFTNITQDAAGSSWRAFQQGSAIG